MYGIMIVGSNTVSQRHWSLKERAIGLRKQGLSYKEILKKVPVAKSSISLWCRHVPLSAAQKKRLWEKRDTQLKGIQAIQKMFWEKRCASFFQGVALYQKMKNNPRFVAGLMLYWAEGAKSAQCAITNSDPSVIVFMAQWFKKFLGVRSNSLSLHLHIHSGQNEQKVKRYWSRLTGISSSNFQKSFVKPEGSGYRKNVLYNGTIKLRLKGLGSTYKLFLVLGSIAGFLKKNIGIVPKPENWMDTMPHA